MSNTEEIFKRATVTGVTEYLLYGMNGCEEERSYEQRTQEAYDKFEKVALKYDADPSSKLLSIANEMVMENASVYAEIGFQAGILLVLDMLKNIHR